METHAKQNPAPVKDKDRIRVLDAIRGIALLGILLMNIYIGGNYGGVEYNQTLIANTTGPNFITTVIISIFFEGKMRALFCMLFGAGLMLYILQKKNPENPKGLWKLYYSRMFWLLIFGLFNAYILLFYYDILYSYAVAGMIVFLMRYLKPGMKTLILPIFILIGLITDNVMYRSDRETRLTYLEATALQEKGEEITPEQTEAIEAWEEIYADMDFSGEKRDENTEKLKSGYLDVASVTYERSFEGQTKYLLFLLTDQIPLMLLGMALLQWGFFTGRWKKKWYLYTLVIGYLVGFPIAINNIYTDLYIFNSEEAFMNFIDNNPFIWFELNYQVQRIFLVMGHVSLIVLLHKANVFSWLLRRLEAVGQMALTNYLMQSVLVTFFFFGYGLNYFDELEFYQLYYVVGVIWILQIAYSPIWLRYYRFGPCEWLWRSLTYWRKMPFKRSTPGIVAMPGQPLQVKSDK
ncbi:DUF418 domain-containing protein [Robertkochia marina]|uniref:DUF418 domain-containing protein n=1 Tax=Robertkochia marina TaxID=1227945 RepID=A0A4S3M216_9FLAO|nr:DUF418 domain-containing protein [Robertkochia marina]THD69152.1 DUF418 domain-containing protein [Robertkochia marina]TRZ47589.1 DUF418 domain-containing protein [Robertkochia marina]